LSGFIQNEESVSPKRMSLRMLFRAPAQMSHYLLHKWATTMLLPWHSDTGFLEY